MNLHYVTSCGIDRFPTKEYNVGHIPGTGLLLNCSFRDAIKTLRSIQISSKSKNVDKKQDKASKMKLFNILALAAAQKVPDMTSFKQVLADGGGNAQLIQQMVEFYLEAAGIDTVFSSQLLSYGCWCQILGDERKHGLGEPFDALDQICKGKIV